MKDYCQIQNGDLDLSTGDIYPAESTTQHQHDLLLGDLGHIRHRPELGIGAVEYLLNNDREGLLRRTRQMLTADGQKVEKVGYDIQTYELEIKARYEDD